MYENLKVIGARLVVKENEVEEKTRGGVILTPSQQQRNYSGVVLLVGEGAFLENGTIKPMTVQPGDEVIFAKFAGTPITYKDEKLIILNERDVLLVIKGAGTTDGEVAD